MIPVLLAALGAALIALGAITELRRRTDSPVSVPPGASWSVSPGPSGCDHGERDRRGRDQGGDVWGNQMLEAALPTRSSTVTILVGIVLVVAAAGTTVVA